ncbi:hypothetical protein AUEXF2481DRAFT_37184 [Aureobasidium subglaciale EXF-2481]|uniref:Mitochondrial intermembrane space import and assembly protein 40 n=1 Tax=Aureobasidium subglaciale (strain EXF-2481) TaxID=1043005 RepID=A0A074YJ02_AURSE|nr:uncharacterized protein AUEXF2481DRAFT_37184 [Aureobasidium subglaciale EXF-2481]KAI5195051.1 hypothetical protein E4T38_09266 [Aureobasidium subglaciale]KAI5214144.1 hypothetical protein E4T40_09217 [Aureobasidium subglaciale]KAI5216569.1 hypothetical protein E4T41_09218 [Aureobasidium subglaciale]KAI5254458.1 hypothetical protein E4T46_09173 [Aureobasidium subglaciale]KEQ97645.1 hypothetical protein AUEXF2481DRAFT_37184 [Aureobasidium subglaciale EXF-2481]
MFRPIARRAVAQASRSSAPSRRFLSTAPPHEKSRSWKNSAVRWTLAGALVYYYNTSNVFAEEQSYVRHAPPETQIESETLPTLDAVTAKRQALQAQLKAGVEADAKKAAAAATDAAHKARQATTNAPVPEPEDGAAAGSPQDLEEEAGQQGAFNEETGEINWDCPCLGGMAHGPCGEQFREAFSCFVFSKEEPKGMDCIDKFKDMQNCFREHPDIYGAELDDDVEDEARAQDAADQPGQSSQPSQPEANPDAEKVAHKEADHPDAIQAKRERSSAASEQVKRDHSPTSESDSLVPKAAHDATGQ